MKMWVLPSFLPLHLKYLSKCIQVYLLAHPTLLGVTCVMIGIDPKILISFQSCSQKLKNDVVL